MQRLRRQNIDVPRRIQHESINWKSLLRTRFSKDIVFSPTQYVFVDLLKRNLQFEPKGPPPPHSPSSKVGFTQIFHNRVILHNNCLSTDGTVRQVTIFWGRRAKRFICISSREELVNIKTAFHMIAGKKVVCKFDHDLFMHLELDSLKLQNIVQLILFNINQCVFYNNSVTMYMNTLFI